ncbi:4Fe-4S single cluster domain-containing protein [Arthrobacter oryzae]|uniref:4Fe-4S single cluster domain-containing protein n=1 Tax=Arthrobacter oryzae TaxID=409290 RepID=UPI00273A8FBA|nr:4Fe-4S single cluster domain-containing protein [Arthrobacter oryzae]WLQ07111.1 4Fe-4S single cluster domain-containing protein [Arthrobacter oryzae]
MPEISRLHFPVTSLGYGRRAGIWFQGCTVRCPGCMSRDTWPSLPESRMAVKEILQWLGDLRGHVDGVTISGGEPSEQPEALRELVEKLRLWEEALENPLDILLYSGRPLEEVVAELPWIPALVDVLISDPFEQEAPTDLGLRGSSNQRVNVFSALGAERYSEDDLATVYMAQRREIGVQVDGSSVWMTGIPLEGDLKALDAALRQKGVTMGRKSWFS